MKKLLATLSIVFIAGCSSTTPTVTSTPPTFTSEQAQTVVYRTQGYYAAAVRTEIAYANLPRCGRPTSPALCSDISTIKNVRKASDSAWVAIKEAQVAARTPSFGENKVTTVVTSAVALTNAFVEITNTLKVK